MTSAVYGKLQGIDLRFKFQDMLARVPTALAFEKPNAVMESRLYAIKKACWRLDMGVTGYFIYIN